MENNTYFKDGLARILDLLKDTFGDEFKVYFSGQPEEIPESSLPCIMVSEGQGRITSGPTGTDIITETIVIILAKNKKDDIGASSEDDLTEFQLRKLVKGQDPDTREYLPKTVMYALRKHITLSNAAHRTTFDTDFALNIRGESTITQEAYVTVTIEREALVPNRD